MESDQRLDAMLLRCFTSAVCGHLLVKGPFTADIPPPYHSAVFHDQARLSMVCPVDFKDAPSSAAHDHLKADDSILANYPLARRTLDLLRIVVAGQR